MSPVQIGVLVLISLLVLMFLGVTVSTSIGILGLIGLLIMIPAAFRTKVGISVFETLDSYNAAAIPLFSLMAMIICYTGIGAKLYDAFYKLIGRYNGGLSIATILACGLFAAISSSASATTLTIGLIALPEMRKAQYKDTLIAGSICAGGTMGPFIPPSSPLLVYGIITGTSVIKLFSAIIVPGIIMIIMYSLTIVILCKRKPELGPKGPKFSTKEVLIAFSKCGEILLLILIVLGGMFAGFFTPTEAAGVGAAGAILITFVRRTLNSKNFFEAIVGAMKTSGMIFAMFVAAAFMNYLMSLSRLPTTVANALSAAHIPPLLVVVFMILILMLMGMFMDGAGINVLTTPIFFPIIQALGINPVWFGVIVCTCMEMGAITPPVGSNLFVMKSLDKSTPMEVIYKGVYPFFAAQIAAIAIFLFFPAVSLTLPAILA
ncbi:MAG: TRAP transporter large permease [Oscillospiraceae bacterium]|nr:TRAP transporter large permease [Oscillospiraceae bacterium]